MTSDVTAGRSSDHKRRRGATRGAGHAVDSYYGLPILKAPVWESREIAGNSFFLGGLAGASSLFAAGAQLTDRHELAVRAKVVATGAIGSAASLWSRTSGARFALLQHVRVFKPTSPMSVGSWLLAAYAPASGIAAVSAVTGRWSRAGSIATAATVVLGPAISTYTATLVSDTAVPAWHDGHRGCRSSSRARARRRRGGVALITASSAQAASARRLAFVGAALETVSSQLMKRRMGMVAEPYHQGKAGRYTEVRPSTHRLRPRARLARTSPPIPRPWPRASCSQRPPRRRASESSKRVSSRWRTPAMSSSRSTPGTPPRPPRRRLGRSAS